MEYLDIVDEYGEPTGQIVERSYAHEQGILHRTSHVWIFRKKGETLVVYLNSSSKTDARQLALVNAATKAEVTVFTAPPDDEAHAGKASCAIPADGTYLLYSKGSGINLYAVICE